MWGKSQRGQANEKFSWLRVERVLVVDFRTVVNVNSLEEYIYEGRWGEIGV